MTKSDELEVRRLIERYLSQSMTEQDAKRWLEYVEAQPKLNDELLDHLALDDMLRDLSRGGQIDSSLAQAVVEVIEPRGRLWGTLWVHTWSRRHPAWASAACLVLFVAIATLVGLLASHGPVTKSGPVIQREIVVHEKVKPIVCARLEASADPVWGDSVPDKHWVPGEQCLAGPYEIRSGLVRLRFLSGATVLVAGPARFELLSSDRIACSLGRLDVVVPPEAVGFRVDLPETSVIDLGTVFSTITTEKGSEIQVLQGRVALTEISAGQSILDAGLVTRFFEGAPARRYHVDLSQRKTVDLLTESPPELFSEHFAETKNEQKTNAKVLLPDCFLIAQRTSGRSEPENVIATFRKALKLGVDACELDVTEAGDGTLYAIHPGSSKLISSNKKPFSELSRQEIKRETLDDVFEFFRNESTCPIVVDVFDAKSVPAVIEAIQRNGLSDRVVLTGRNEASAKAIKQLRPSLCVGLCVDVTRHSPKDEQFARKILEKATEVGVDFVKLEYPLVSAELVAELRKNGLPAWIYTVDTAEGMDYCRQIGAAGILTCRSDLLAGADRSKRQTAPPPRPEQQITHDITD